MDDKPIASTNDPRETRKRSGSVDEGFSQGRNDIQIHWLAHAARLLAAIENGDGFHSFRKCFNEALDGERPDTGGLSADRSFRPRATGD